MILLGLHMVPSAQFIIETLGFKCQADGLQPSEKIAAFDFDGCLANTDVRRYVL